MTDHYHNDKETEHTEDNDSPSSKKDSDNLVQNKMVTNFPMSMHFQNKVISFVSNNIPKFDATIVKTKEQYFKILSSENCNFLHQLQPKNS